MDWFWEVLGIAPAALTWGYLAFRNTKPDQIIALKAERRRGWNTLRSLMVADV